MSEQYKHKDSGRMQLVHEAIDELRELKVRGEFQPTQDIDMVWVLSNPGTVKTASQDGIYKGDKPDLRAVEHGIDIVRKVTAVRLGKALSEVTLQDIEQAGPSLYYNGEDEDTVGINYEQNKDLVEMLSQPDSLMPMSKVVIGHIDRIGTPAQVEDIARYLKDHPVEGKIVVVTSAEHSVRVGRYLEHYKDLLPPGTPFINAPFAEQTNKVGKTLREVRKVADYAEKGDLAKQSYFAASRLLGQPDPAQMGENKLDQD